MNVNKMTVVIRCDYVFVMEVRHYNKQMTLLCHRPMNIFKCHYMLMISIMLLLCQKHMLSVTKCLCGLIDHYSPSKYNCSLSNAKNLSMWFLKIYFTVITFSFKVNFVDNFCIFFKAEIMINDDNDKLYFENGSNPYHSLNL